jgi:acetylornithine deacetylase
VSSAASNDVEVVEVLSKLIAIATHQPGPSDQGGSERALCEYLVPLLLAARPDELAIVDAPRALGGGGAYLFARWGQPRVMINAHSDTVPANQGWTRDPWTPAVEGGKVHGLGAADIKGAIAAAVVALRRGRPKNAALLFSGDEERGTASVSHFLSSPRRAGVEFVVVCEPTTRVAGVAHRGVLAHTATVRGRGGHSSRADHLPRPLATLARLAVALDEIGRARLHDGPPEMAGLCLNLASLSGGVAFNVVPDQATLSWSIRPWPGFDRSSWDRDLRALVARIDPQLQLATVVDHAPFACQDRDLARRLVGDHCVTTGPLDFWTEAALYQAAGIPAVVVGPGSIDQAHAPDEHVAIDDLVWAVDLFASVLAGRS